MTRFHRGNGFSLVLLGAAGIVFFWATDPRSIHARWPAASPIDAANQAWMGTLMGVAGSGVVLTFGLWLLMRKSV